VKKSCKKSTSRKSGGIAPRPLNVNLLNYYSLTLYELKDFRKTINPKRFPKNITTDEETVSVVCNIMIFKIMYRVSQKKCPLVIENYVSVLPKFQ